MVLVATWLTASCFAHPRHAEPALGHAAGTVQVRFQPDRADARLRLQVDGRSARLASSFSTGAQFDTSLRVRPGWRHIQLRVTTQERRCNQSSHRRDATSGGWSKTTQCTNHAVTRCQVARLLHLRDGQQVILTIQLKDGSCVITCGWRHVPRPGQVQIRRCRDRPAALRGGWIYD
jgi:hypothetical protein